MTVGNVKETCNLEVKLRSGSSFIVAKPIFTYDTKNLIIAHGTDLKVFNIQSGECLHTLKHHSSQIISVCGYKNNQLQVYSSSDDGCVVRWDYNEGKTIKVRYIKKQIVNFFAPLEKDLWYVTVKTKGDDNADVFKLLSIAGEKEQEILRSVAPYENHIAFGHECQFLAAILENVLTVFNCHKRNSIRHLIPKDHRFTCVSCHPSKEVLATGDDSGRVFVWSNIFERHPIRSKYHWHTLPLADVAFSTEGCYLYSGGGEAALVKWNLFADGRSIIPRLGAPIKKITVSPNNSFVAISQNDNSLQVINSQSKIVQIIQGLTQSYFHGAESKDVMPAGVLYDSQTRSLVLNGKPGHLQFYNIREDKQLFNLDISGRNFISQEQTNAVYNIDVHKAAIDENGQWLATAEYWNDKETSPQIWLKFWNFDLTSQMYVLNTNIILPHNKEVNCIIFQPSVDFKSPPYALTTSKDTRFKTWILTDDDCFDDKQSWGCSSVGCYRDLPAGNASFSEDGSLFAVAFGNVATLWTVENTVLRAALTHEKSHSDIIQVLFGRKSCSHFLICHDGNVITAWNIVSLSISWIVHIKIEIIAFDPLSDIMAAFCKGQTLNLFKPSSPKPLFTAQNVSKHSVISAIFAPKHKESHKENLYCFHNKSQLFFFDDKQNLFVLTEETDCTEESNKVSVKQNIPLTPFGMLQPELKISSVETLQPELLPVDTISNSKAIQITCPRLVEPISLCTKTLQSLLIPIVRSEVSEVKQTAPINTTEESNTNSLEDSSTKKEKSNIHRLSNFSFLLKRLKLSS